MKSSRMFWILAVVAILFVLSIYFSKQKLKFFATHPPAEKVVVVDSNQGQPLPPVVSGISTLPAGPVTPSQPAGSENKTTAAAAPTAVPQPTACKPQSEYADLHGQLGRLVNSDELRHNHQEFLKRVDQFRAQYGLPFAMITLPTNKLEEQGIVFNNCHPSCKGMVNQVFVSRLVNNRFAEVYTKAGVLKQIPLHDSGLDVSTVDELNGKGVPFRSWRVPTVDTDWYVLGNKLYYAMDIQGLWLEVDTAGHWIIVTDPKGLSKLVSVEPAAKVAGCVPDENCLQVAAGGGHRARYFKAPKACSAVLSHAADEPVDHSTVPIPVPHPGPGPGTTDSAPNP